MKTIKNMNFPSERALYAEKDIILNNCTFDGEEDGESALKEAKNVRLEKCLMNLRYPLWHVNKAYLSQCEMTDKCRAALWYSKDITISDSTLGGIKVLRECENVKLGDTDIISPEFCWKCRGVFLKDCSVSSEYPFFLSSDIKAENLSLQGKYSFQYTSDVLIEDSVLDTKDAFWHAKNAVIKNSVIRGEYLAWYSDGLTLINCRIIGTQPLCYCKNLKLVDCEMEKTDLSFEYSEVEASVKGHIDSVKNPFSGKITAGDIGEIILTEDSVYPCRCLIEQKANQNKQ